MTARSCRCSQSRCPAPWASPGHSSAHPQRWSQVICHQDHGSGFRPRSRCQSPEASSDFEIWGPCLRAPPVQGGVLASLEYIATDYGVAEFGILPPGIAAVSHGKQAAKLLLHAVVQALTFYRIPRQAHAQQEPCQQVLPSKKVSCAHADESYRLEAMFRDRLSKG